ncbi:MAG TPA: hypothetical protein VFG30_32475 [Polyangiales bacterium]|nr:hypothetical protein [Polyangiales bacterium]
MNQKKIAGLLLVFAIAVGWYSSLRAPSAANTAPRAIENDGLLADSVEARRPPQPANGVAVATPERSRRVLELVEAAPTPRPNDGVRDDEVPRNADAPEQRAWRDRYRLEASDERWTKQMDQLLTEKGQAVLHGNVEVENLDCHETVCRMYLEFEREPDAEIFLPVAFESSTYRSRSVSAPGAEGEPAASYAYEVLVERPRPDDLPQRADARLPTTLAISVSASGATP